MNLQNVKTMLFTEMNSLDEENKCIEKYRSELNTLLKEKQALVDELRQVETDICDVSQIKLIKIQPFCFVFFLNKNNFLF